MYRSQRCICFNSIQTVTWVSISWLAPAAPLCFGSPPLDIPGLYIQQCVTSFYVAEALLGVMCPGFTLVHLGVALSFVTEGHEGAFVMLLNFSQPSTVTVLSC